MGASTFEQGYIAAALDYPRCRRSGKWRIRPGHWPVRPRQSSMPMDKGWKIESGILLPRQVLSRRNPQEIRSKARDQPKNQPFPHPSVGFASNKSLDRYSLVIAHSAKRSSVPSVLPHAANRSSPQHPFDMRSTVALALWGVALVLATDGSWVSPVRGFDT
jgi:hypothetical protein